MMGPFESGVTNSGLWIIFNITYTKNTNGIDNYTNKLDVDQSDGVDLPPPVPDPAQLPVAALYFFVWDLEAYGLIRVSCEQQI